MDGLNNIILLTMAYLITSVALTWYDFSAPPIDRKGDVIQKNYKALKPAARGSCWLEPRISQSFFALLLQDLSLRMSLRTESIERGRTNPTRRVPT